VFQLVMAFAKRHNKARVVAFINLERFLMVQVFVCVFTIGMCAFCAIFLFDYFCYDCRNVSGGGPALGHNEF
jgi:hypothetical protein